MHSADLRALDDKIAVRFAPGRVCMAPVSEAGSRCLATEGAHPILKVAEDNRVRSVGSSTAHRGVMCKTDAEVWVEWAAPSCSIRATEWVGAKL